VKQDIIVLIIIRKKNWHKIIYYLNSKSGEYKNISVINRAKIIDDAFHLMMARQFNISTFWELTKYLSQEIDFVAWYPMIKVFEYMSTVFPFPIYKFKYIDIKVMRNYNSSNFKYFSVFKLKLSILFVLILPVIYSCLCFKYIKAF